MWGEDLLMSPLLCPSYCCVRPQIHGHTSTPLNTTNLEKKRGYGMSDVPRPSEQASVLERKGDIERIT